MSALISLLLPTRGRPELAERFLRSAVDNAESPQDVEAVIYVDEDDVQSRGIGVDGLESRIIVGPRVSMGRCNSECLRSCAGEIFILANDDVVVRTSGWDRRIRELHESVPDRIYLAHPNDLFKKHRVCTFPILSRRTAELLGEPFPQEYRGAFIDYHLLDIFKRLEARGSLRLFYLGDVIFEHMHHRVGKAGLDATYRDRRRFDDDATFLALRNRRERDARRLLRAIGGQMPEGELARSPTGPQTSPRRQLGMVAALCKGVLFDPGLPLQWRWQLGFWFLGRMLAARGLLPGIAR